MIDNFIYFCGEHLETIVFFFILFIYIVFIISLLRSIEFSTIVFAFCMIFLALFVIFINSNYDRIKEKKFPCEYPIDTKYHYTYNDLNNNINTFIGENDSCERDYSNNSLICHFDNTYVQVVSYSYEKEEIYAKGCDK